MRHDVTRGLLDSLPPGERQFELPVRTSVFAATLDGAGSDVGGVEDLDIRWRMADGSVVPAVTQ